MSGNVFAKGGGGKVQGECPAQNFLFTQVETHKGQTNHTALPKACLLKNVSSPVRVCNVGAARWQWHAGARGSKGHRREEKGCSRRVGGGGSLGEG